MVSFFSSGQGACGKPQYGSERPSKFFKDTGRVEEIIQRDRRVTVREIASELDLSYDDVQRIVTDELRYSKVCARWFPRALSAEHKATRMMCSLTFLQRYHSDGQHFIDPIVTGDKTWLHPFTSTSKRATMEWKHAGSPTRKKFKVTPSAEVCLDNSGSLSYSSPQKKTVRRPVSGSRVKSIGRIPARLGYVRICNVMDLV
ncbi:histone-lysine N-methyltransferase SETMAR [Nephila pilipes]|uniref:Histone-lysine N-methyltransferase SETMAR n=1 Tax=Nephila pilipes TaxID=299642 RepID=A0A8X6T665_NEPPI|nr:histone-lysine N-methyltransferase SETMAR [Nephila pilipes]